MTVPELIVLCEGCGARLANLLATCTNRACLVEDLAELARIDRRIEATS